MALETDIRDIALDDKNDIVITDDIQFVSGIEAVAQECRIALQMFQGEWFLDLDIGIPYWEEILGKRSDIAVAAARAAFRQALEEVEDVTEVIRLDVSYVASTRAMSITWQVRCAFGDTPVDTLAVPIAA